MTKGLAAEVPKGTVTAYRLIYPLVWLIQRECIETKGGGGG